MAVTHCFVPQPFSLSIFYLAMGRSPVTRSAQARLFSRLLVFLMPNDRAVREGQQGSDGALSAQIGGLDLLIGQQLGTGAEEGQVAGLQYIGVVCDLQGHIGVLLVQQHRSCDDQRDGDRQRQTLSENHGEK